MSTQTTYPPPPPLAPAGPPAGDLDVEIVLPVYNEQRALADSVRKLHAHLGATCAFAWQITIAENASSDSTPQIADELASELPGVAVLHLSEKGRGRALRTAWTASRAAVVAYMDIDLSTDLRAVGDLLAPLLEERGDIVIGSRLVPGAEVTRSLRREVVSRTYNLILRASLGVSFADAQCGFKAARRDAVRDLLADVADDGWFFDTELLYAAQRSRLSIREIPVRWVEDRDSRVAIVATALADLRGIARLRQRGARPAAGAGRPSRQPAARPETAPAGTRTTEPSEVTHDHTLRLGPRRASVRTAAPAPQTALAARTARQSPLAL